MVIVKNDTEFFKIYEDQGEYIILGPGEVKEMHSPEYKDVSMSMETADMTLRTLMGEKIRCYDPVSGRTFYWRS